MVYLPAGEDGAGASCSVTHFGTVSHASGASVAFGAEALPAGAEVAGR